MADRSLDTQSAGYQNHLQRFRDLKAFYAPFLVDYFKLTEDQQKAWRQSDPLLRELLDFVRKVSARKNAS